MHSRSALALVLFASSVVGQGSVVSPREFTNAEAPSSSGNPFGTTTTPYRYVAVHDDMQGTSRQINALALRRNGNNTTSFSAYSLTLDLWCSTALTTASAPNATFDLNHGPDKVQVVTRQTLNMPATDMGLVPSPFAYQVPFNVGFVYLGTAGLCWEAQITTRTNTQPVSHDAAFGSSSNPPMPAGWYGAGCTTSGQVSSMSVIGTASMNWPAGTGTLTVLGFFGPISAPITLILGTDNTRWGTLPLPWVLPGSPTSPSGPCTLYTDILVTLPSSTSPTGQSTTTIPVPAQPWFNGARTFAQLAAFDAPANPFGIVLSDVVNHNWVAPYGQPAVGRVSLAGSLGSSGTVGANAGLVVRFDP